MYDRLLTVNITLNLHIGINGLAYERLLTENLVHYKVFLKTFFFWKYCYIFYKNVPIETILWVNPSPKYLLAYIQEL